MDVDTYLSTEYTHESACFNSKNRIETCGFIVTQVVRIGDECREEFKQKIGGYSQLKDILLAWCSANCGGKYECIRGFWDYAFELENDAIMFRLRWG